MVSVLEDCVAAVQEVTDAAVNSELAVVSKDMDVVVEATGIAVVLVVRVVAGAI